jgi:hypothetical protein
VPRVNSQRARLAPHESYSVTRSNSRDGLRKRPKMNAICEHVIGTMRRECLDRLSPLSASHLCFIPAVRRGELYGVRAISIRGGLTACPLSVRGGADGQA